MYDFIKNKTCPYCQSRIKSNADFTVCSHCGTPHHTECWNENGGCTTYGCINNPNTENKFGIDPADSDSIDVGNETIESLRASLKTTAGAGLMDCPNCNSMIEPESVYCKYCGFNVIENKFDDVKPDNDKSGKDEKEEFEEEYRKRYKQKINVSRKRFILTAISFLILFSAVGYLLYYTVNRLNIYFSSDEYKIRNTVENWKDAWEDKNIDKYKSYLTGDYTYYGSDGKKTDLKEKLNRIEYTFKIYDNIKIRISDFEFVSDSVFTENDRKVQFKEKYESDKFNEEGLKTLRLYKGEETNGEWKIYREIFKEKQ